MRAELWSGSLHTESNSSTYGPKLRIILIHLYSCKSNLNGVKPGGGAVGACNDEIALN